MEVGHLELFVKDPLASKRFYCEILGFELVTIQNDTFVWIKNGTIEILLRPGSPQKAPQYQQTNMAIVLYTDDLEASTTRLEDHRVQIRGTDGASNCLTFTDLDGHWFQLVNPQQK